MKNKPELSAPRPNFGVDRPGVCNAVSLTVDVYCERRAWNASQVILARIENTGHVHGNGNRAARRAKLILSRCPTLRGVEQYSRLHDVSRGRRRCGARVPRY